MSKIKLPFKIYNNKTTEWILANFPENYSEYEYVEPYTSHGSLLYNKNDTKLTVINDQSSNLVNVYRAFRDEPKDFYNKLVKIKSTEETFKKHYKKYHENLNEEYFENASTELVMNLMSRNHQKKALNTEFSTDSWKKSIKALYNISNKLKNVYILNRNPVDILKTFESKNTLFFFELPYLYEIKSLKEKNMPIQQEQSGIFNLIQHSKSKFIVYGTQLFYYKNLYSAWNMTKNKSSTKAEYLWKNF